MLRLSALSRRSDCTNSTVLFAMGMTTIGDVLAKGNRMLFLKALRSLRPYGYVQKAYKF